MLRSCSLSFALSTFALGCSTASHEATSSHSSDASHEGSDGAAGLTGDGGHTSVVALWDGGSLTDSDVPGCGESKLQAAPKQANVLLVVDASGSMNDLPQGFPVDKWTALRGALTSALQATSGSVSYGLELFPYPKDPSKPIPVSCGTDCCEMPDPPGINVTVDVGTVSVAKILDALASSSPAGGTPTALALSRAYDYFTSGAGAGLVGDKYVLLATDGGPDCNPSLTCEATSCTTNLDGLCPTAGANCCDPSKFGGSAANSRCLDDSATKAQIDQLRSAQIRTFVVGIPGSEAYQTSLDAFAEAGGEVSSTTTPKYFAVSAAGGAAHLTSVLTQITESLITTCQLVLSSDPPNPEDLNVSIDGKLVPQSGPDGWRLDTTQSPPTVVLEGATCARVESMGVESVQIVYGCPTLFFQ